RTEGGGRPPNPFAPLRLRVRQTSAELIRHQFGESIGAMADAVFFFRVDLREGPVAALRHEYRIVAEAAIAARGPGEGAVGAAFVNGLCAIGPGEGEGAGEPGVAR